VTIKLHKYTSFWSIYSLHLLSSCGINCQGNVGIKSLLPPNCKCTFQRTSKEIIFYTTSVILQWASFPWRRFIKLPSSDCWLHSSWSCGWLCLSWPCCLVLWFFMFTGRRRTMAVLLRLYTSLSSIAVAFSVTCIIRSELFGKVWTLDYEISYLDVSVSNVWSCISCKAPFLHALVPVKP
jgi:hypothetical protein